MESFGLVLCLVLLSLVSAVCVVRSLADVIRDLGDQLNNLKGGGGSGPSHPLPVTSPVETSRGSANPKE
jgi:hypothetical protein